MVVDDSMVFRKQMQNMLENLFYKVITVAHGEEALNLINLRDDISLVLTDYNMPVMDGLELTAEIRKKHDKNDISILAISSNNDEEINALFLKEGANDYINKPYSKEEFSCRVNNSIEALENINIITNAANRDFLTGLYNRRYFFKNVQSYFYDAVKNNEDFAILMVDIDHFKKINDTYGHDTGDKAIVHLSEILKTNTNQGDVVARFGGEEFCLLLKSVTPREANMIAEKFKNKTQHSSIVSDKGEEIKFTISVGLATTHEATLEDSVNDSDDLLYQAKNNGRNQVISN